MDKFLIDGVEVLVDGLPDVTEAEAQGYVDYTRPKIHGRLGRLIIRYGEAPRTVKLEWATVQEKFERIRRITGYLVGTIDRWNNAKRAEEQDRYKHIRRK